MSKVIYSNTAFHELKGEKLEDIKFKGKKRDVTWINVEGLHNISIMEHFDIGADFWTKKG